MMTSHCSHNRSPHPLMALMGIMFIAVSLGITLNAHATGGTPPSNPMIDSYVTSSIPVATPTATAAMIPAYSASESAAFSNLLTTLSGPQSECVITITPTNRTGVICIEHPESDVCEHVKVLSPTKILDLTCTVEKLLYAYFPKPSQYTDGPQGVQDTATSTSDVALNKERKFLNQLVVGLKPDVKKCTTDVDCSGDLSCLTAEAQDLYSNDKLKLMELITDASFQYPLFLMSKHDGSPSGSGEVAESCMNSGIANHYQCESFYCDATTNKCKPQLACRKAHEGEKVKASAAAGAGCDEGLTRSSIDNICRVPSTESDVGLTYKNIMSELNNAPCGNMSLQYHDQYRNLLLQRKAFEMMVELSPQFKMERVGLSYYGISTNLLMLANVAPGLVDLQIQNATNSLFAPVNNQKFFQKLTPYIKENVLNTSKNQEILLAKSFNENYQKFMTDFYTILNVDEASQKKINFLDTDFLEKQLAKNAVDGEQYAKLYLKWIELQSKYYTENGAITDARQNDFNNFLGTYFSIKKNDSDPKLWENSGKKNKEKFLSQIGVFGRADQINTSDKINLDLLNSFKPNANYEFFKSQSTIGHPNYFLDWPLPPDTNLSNGANDGYHFLLKNYLLPTSNSHSIIDYWIFGEVYYNLDLALIDHTTSPTPRDAHSMMDGLYDRWLAALKAKYTALSQDKQPNDLIDVELNLYAGCFMPESANNKNFYFYFCGKDSNKNGVLDPGEDRVNITLQNLAKNILTMSLLYGYTESVNDYRQMFGGTLSMPLNENLGSVTYQYSQGFRNKLFSRIYEIYIALAQINQGLPSIFDKQKECIKKNGTTFSATTSNIQPGFGARENFINNSTSTNNQRSTAKTSPTDNLSEAAKSKALKVNNLKAFSQSSNYPAPSLSVSGENFNNGSTIAAMDPDKPTSEVASSNQDKVAKKGKYATVDSIKSNNARNSNTESNDYKIMGGNAGGVTSSSTTEAAYQNAVDQAKIRNAINSKSDAPLVDDDSIFGQITERYIKTGYARIFNPQAVTESENIIEATETTDDTVQQNHGAGSGH